MDSPPDVVHAVNREVDRALPMLRRHGYQRDDIEQEFAIHWRLNRHRHDPSRASEATFAAALCRNRAISLWQAATSAKRGAGKVYSFSELPFHDEHGRKIERPESVSQEVVESGFGRRPQMPLDSVHLYLDLDRVLDGVPAELAAVAQLVRRGNTPTEVAGHLKISRASAYRRLAELGQVCRQGGLDEYCIAEAA